MQISKADIDRIGNEIRAEQNGINEELLLNLQQYRTSHKVVLSQVFNMLCDKTKKIPMAIVSNRIKRFESIIGKLKRYPGMRFSRMWDIGGCRCILMDDNEVYRLRDIIDKEANFSIVKEKDYIESPQQDGYRSLHLFIKHKNNERIIEVQLRNRVDHNWATLVEITDVIFDTRVKELGNNEDLVRFHYLLSKIDTLDIDGKKEISKILTKYNYFGKLSEVFSRNYVKVRRQWFEIESRNNHKYFLIETKKNEVPKINSFDSSTDAENYHFNAYKTRQNANIVLTHLQRPNYKQMSIAYSNYILTFHTFLTDCYDILESLIVESLEKGEYYQYFKIYNLYNGLVYNHINNLFIEVREIQTYLNANKFVKRRDKSKEREWLNDIRRQIDSSNDRSKKLAKKFTSCLPDKKLNRIIINGITKYIRNKYRRKINNIIKASFQAN